MIGKIFSVLVTASVVFATLGGRMPELSEAVLDGASDAVELVISLLGMMCLWSGVIKVLDRVGVTRVISRLSRPLLRFIYPVAYSKDQGADEIASNFAANLLGMGNAALPLGLSAMEKLACQSKKEGSPNREMITFAVLNTVPFQLFPTTLISLRSSAGSLSAYEIIAPIYVCSALTICFAVLLCKTFPMREEL